MRYTGDRNAKKEGCAVRLLIAEDEEDLAEVLSVFF